MWWSPVQTCRENDCNLGIIYNRKWQKPFRRRLRNRMTRAERTLWFSLRGRQVGGFKFRRQHGIGKYVVDFYCPELKLAIEADGDSHLSEEAKAYDARRQEWIEQFGVRFLRFTNDEIFSNADRVIGRIGEEVRRIEAARASRDH